MGQGSRSIIKFLSLCFIFFLIILALLIAVSAVYSIYSISDYSSGSNIPVVIPSSPEPEFEEAETPSSLTSVDAVESGYSSDTSDTYVRTYSWNYSGYNQTITVTIPVEYYDYYRNKSHTGKDFDHYALSENDRVFLGKMIDSFKEQGEKCNFTSDQNVLNIIAFVQAMPYTSDSVTTGYDEYPRYPIETLVDGGGDCEDSSILAAALLLEMGYGVVLLELPGHMALGVKGSEDILGAYYEFEGSRYYYVETTDPNFKFGELPPEFIDTQVRAYSMNPFPSMNVSIRADYVDKDRNYVYYNICCIVTNTGPTSGQNVTAVILAESEPFDMTLVWSQSGELSLGTLADDDSDWVEYTVKIPRRNHTRFSCVVYGDNFDPEYAYTKIVYMD
ncbi:hypothetical protein LJC08_00400 [Methanimicrococcus sp. OttesenSCG-928-J09]|nr:hypothetical protein [Methanimicrococcus sp. OttesenSCG-928-J09]